MTLGTRLLTWLRGELVGTDSLGNRYYREKGNRPLRRGGGRIKFTQAPVSLENLIGQMIFSQPGAQKKPEEGEAPPK